MDRTSALYKEVLSVAVHFSDHHERVADELEPSLEDALAHTPPSAKVVEVGNLEGGSGALILWHLAEEGKGREFLTVDCNDKHVGRVGYWAERMGVQWSNVQNQEVEWFRNLHREQPQIGFLYHDGDHDQGHVVDELLLAAPWMVKNGIIAVDDVNSWQGLPDLSAAGLERVYYDVPQGPAVGPEGLHVAYWVKV